MSKEDKPVRQRAVALRYEQEDRAPKIVATGAGEIARRIVELAEQNDIPIKQDDTLVDILGKLDVDYEIPPETYRAVAEILAFLYRTDDKWRKRVESKGSITPERLGETRQVAEIEDKSAETPIKKEITEAE